jgi:hypothetical protein
MGVDKLSVSLEPDLAEAIKRAAASRSVNVSAWLADAARDRLRNEALGDAIETWEREHGPLTEAEVDAASDVLERAVKSRRGAA